MVLCTSLVTREFNFVTLTATRDLRYYVRLWSQGNSISLRSLRQLTTILSPNPDCYFIFAILSRCSSDLGSDPGTVTSAKRVSKSYCPQVLCQNAIRSTVFNCPYVLDHDGSTLQRSTIHLFLRVLIRILFCSEPIFYNKYL